MPLCTFNHLVQIIWDDVYIDEVKSQQSTKGESMPIYPELVVALGIRWMAGLEYAALRNWSGISDGSLRRCIDLFLNAIICMR
jgi:hypothetical protein